MCMRLGATLYHLLTGRPPFQAATPGGHAGPGAERRAGRAAPAESQRAARPGDDLPEVPGEGTGQTVSDRPGCWPRSWTRFLERASRCWPGPLARPARSGAGAGGTRAWRVWPRRGALEFADRVGRRDSGNGASGRSRKQLLARRNAYAADMNLVQRALEDSDLGRARELLNRHRPVGKSEIRNPKSEIDLRGWEWRYLWARCQSDERFTLCQYSNAVSALAFSPDGKWLAVRQRRRSRRALGRRGEAAGDRTCRAVGAVQQGPGLFAPRQTCWLGATRMPAERRWSAFGTWTTQKEIAAISALSRRGVGRVLARRQGDGDLGLRRNRPRLGRRSRNKS